MTHNANNKLPQLPKDSVNIDNRIATSQSIDDITANYMENSLSVENMHHEVNEEDASYNTSNKMVTIIHNDYSQVNFNSNININKYYGT